jgi:hypothetical protein
MSAFAELDAAAIPFITVDEADKFHVNDDALRYLKTLTGKVAVVAIAGVYRTGKSYLLNQLMGRPNGFTVGPTVKACTKGLWLWGKAIEVDGGELNILFLDTEGLGSTVRSETYDARIFALALLLSSYFVYNSVGTIDGNAVAKLSLVVNLTKHIHVRSQSSREDSGTEYNQFFPHFLWVVRDFTVKLERDGRKISAREYLEDALKVRMYVCVCGLGGGVVGVHRLKPRVARGTMPPFPVGTHRRCPCTPAYGYTRVHELRAPYSPRAARGRRE